MTRWRALAGEGARYLAASALALALDLGAYSGMIRLAGVDYLVAAPAGFLLGLATIYLLSVRWVFRHRRLRDARAELALFVALGLAGLGLNQAAVYTGVALLGLPYEGAKLMSAAIVFSFNYASRKLLLFTRFS